MKLFELYTLLTKCIQKDKGYIGYLDNDHQLFQYHIVPYEELRLFEDEEMPEFIDYIAHTKCSKVYTILLNEYNSEQIVNILNKNI